MSGDASELAIAYRAVGEIHGDPRNARTHPRKQIDQIAASIRSFGFTNPVLIDEECQLIAGHGQRCIPTLHARLNARRADGSR